MLHTTPVQCLDHAAQRCCMCMSVSLSIMTVTIAAQQHNALLQITYVAKTLFTRQLNPSPPLPCPPLLPKAYSQTDLRSFVSFSWILPVGLTAYILLMALNAPWLQAYIKELESCLYQPEDSSAYERLHVLSSEVTRLMFRRFGHQPSQRTAIFASLLAQHHLPPNTKPSFSTELLVGFAFDLCLLPLNGRYCIHAAEHGKQGPISWGAASNATHFVLCAVICITCVIEASVFFAHLIFNYNKAQSMEWYLLCRTACLLAESIGPIRRTVA